MHIISLKMLRAFWKEYPEAERPLRTWYKIARKVDWKTFAAVRSAFPHADQVGKFTVFNMGGNKYRLIVVIHLNRGKIYVRHVLTHAEYAKGQWKED
jgi:mRNA interferase HigB